MNARENQKGRSSVAASAPRNGIELPMSANQSSMNSEPRKIVYGMPLSTVSFSMRRL